MKSIRVLTVNAPTALNRLIPVRATGGQFVNHIVVLDTGAAASLIHAESPLLLQSPTMSEESLQLTGAFGGTV